MPLGDGLGWNTGAPADTDLRSVGAAEIRDLRTGVEIRANKEHETLDGDTPPGEGGEHRSGSAKAYYVDTAPINRPDPTTVVLASTADDGRIWIDSDNGQAFYWADDAWRVLGVHTVEGTFSGPDITAYNASTTVTVDPGFVTNQFFLLLEALNGEVLPTYALLVADASDRRYRFPREDSNAEAIRIFRTGSVISIIRNTLAALNIHWVAQRWFTP